MHAGQSSSSCVFRQDDTVLRSISLRIFTGIAAVALIASCANNSGTSAPVHNLSDGSPSGTAAISSAGATYTVKPGDTLRKISVATSVDESTIIKLNGITDPNRLRVGQVLRLSDRATDNKTGAAPVQPVSKPVARPLEQSGSTDNPPARAADAAVINLAWPANGKVIQGFSAASKGIDIGGNLGDSVLAAANGKVMYAGNGVRGLGNLVILNHDNGFITAYAHNKTLLVKTGQDVKQGSKIADLGQSDTPKPLNLIKDD